MERKENNLMKNERIESALKWAKRRELRSKQLTLFDLAYQKEINKNNKKKRPKVNKKKAKKVCQGIKAGNKKELITMNPKLIKIFKL